MYPDACYCIVGSPMAVKRKEEERCKKYTLTSIW